MSRANDKNETSVTLRVAESDVGDLRALPPLAHSFPASRKLEEGELRVPFREIALAGGEPPLRVYDTTGPQACDVRDGLPP
jgi:phosphomethylpyrimidine synthase